MRAGTPFLSFAIGSAEPQIQESIKKRLDLDAARRAVEGAAPRGLYTNGFFMLGFPGETASQMLKTLRMSWSLPLVEALFFRVLALPGTVLTKQVEGQGSERLGTYDDFFISDVNLSAVPDAGLTMLIRAAYLGFYGRPGQIYRLIKATKDKSIIPRRAKAFASMLIGRQEGVVPTDEALS